MHVAGQIKNCTERQKFTYMALPSEVNLQLITVGKSSILVMGTDQKFYWMGKSKHQLFK